MILMMMMMQYLCIFLRHISVFLHHLLKYGSAGHDIIIVIIIVIHG